MDNFKQVIDMHPSPCVVHINFKPVYANNAFATFSGFERADDVTSLDSLRVLFADDHWPEAQTRYQQVMSSGGYTKPQIIEHCDVNGEPKLAEITDTVIEWNGEPAMCTYISVVTDIVNRQTQLECMAMTDELTGLMNRRYLSDRLRNHQKSYRENHHYLILIDLDYFKSVNDTFGHLVGDQLLIEIGKALSSLFDTYHRVTRLGGEEFAMIVSALSVQELQDKAAKIHNQVANCNVKTDVDSSCYASCSASMGISGYQQGDTMESWLSRADEALYRAKHQGRNRTEFDDLLQDILGITCK